MKTPVGFLTTRHHPLLGSLLDRFRAHDAVEPVLLYDAKDFSDKDRRIFAERTEGAFATPDVARIAREHRTFDVPDHNGEACRAIVAREELGLLFNAGTPRIIKRGLLAAARIGVLNVHPGILPKYRGATCCEWAIWNDDPVGVTAHFMDEGIDSGPIVRTRELPIARGASYVDVRVALYRLAQEVAVEAVTTILARGLTLTALPRQPDAPVFKPISIAQLAEVKRRLAEGRYRRGR